MGMELVELVYRIEKEFEIYIPDEIATELATPRKVIEYIMLKTKGKYSREEIVSRFWLFLEEESGRDVSKFNEDSRFVDDMYLG